MPEQDLKANKRFEAFYNSELKPLLTDDRQNPTAIRLALALFSWSCALVLGLLWIESGTPAGWWGYGTFLFVFMLVLANWVYSPAVRKADEFEDAVLPRLVEFSGDLRYRRRPQMNARVFDGCHVLPVYREAEMRELFEGIVEGVPLRILNARLIGRKRSLSNPNSGAGSAFSGGYSRFVAFSGLLCEMRTGRFFPGCTVVGPKGHFEGRYRNRLEDHFELDSSSGLRRIFSRQGWEVYADDDARAGDSLSEWLIQKVQSLRASFDEERIIGAVSGHRVLLLIPFRGEFLSLTRDRSDLKGDSERTFEQIRKLTDIVRLIGLQPAETSQNFESSFIERGSRPAVGADGEDGGGCFVVFLAWLIGTAVTGFVFGDAIEPSWRLPWAVLAGGLLGLGLTSLAAGIRNRSVLTLLIASTLLAGAVWMILGQAEP